MQVYIPVESESKTVLVDASKQQDYQHLEQLSYCLNAWGCHEVVLLTLQFVEKLSLSSAALAPLPTQNGENSENT